MREQLNRWVRPGLYLKRWLILTMVGILLISFGTAQIIIIFYDLTELNRPLMGIIALLTVPCGGFLLIAGFRGIHRALLRPLIAPHTLGEWVSRVQTQELLRQGIKMVAIGGGTGLPSALRAMKTVTSNITAVVTVADDGGSSGRLRRSLGVQPPGDLRRNITALAHDEDLMTQLFDFRFESGELEGHNFGNLFLAALVSLEGDMAQAVRSAGRVLAIQGRVLPCTLDDVNLAADVYHRQTNEVKHIIGESNIPKPGWKIERVFLEPPDANPFSEVLSAIERAELVVIGPGSLYTSIIPNLIVKGVAETLRNSPAIKVYVCNIAIQPGETDEYTVADHIEAIESHVGQQVVNVVIANNHYPVENAGPNTIYVQPAPENHPIHQNYRLIYTDLTDNQRPWRHSPEKLREILLHLKS